MTVLVIPGNHLAPNPYQAWLVGDFVPPGVWGRCPYRGPRRGNSAALPSVPQGSSLRATRTLAADFGINFHTVNKAYDLLRQEGLIRLNRKTGAVVTAAEAGTSFPDEWTSRVRTLLAEAVAKGLPAAEVHQACRAILDSFTARRQKETP